MARTARQTGDAIRFVSKPFKRKGRDSARTVYRLTICCKRLGIKKEIAASTSYRLSMLKRARESERIEQQLLGLITPQQARAAEHAGKPIFDLLEQWTKLRRTQGITVKQIEEVHARCERLLSLMEAADINDLDPDEVSLAIAALRDGHDDADGLSLRTCNSYLRSIKQFARWLSRKAGFDDQIRLIKQFNAETDIVHPRRALTDDEVNRLLTAARNGPDYSADGGTITGQQRELLYLLALTSGLRANELRTLKPENFQLDATDLFPAPAVVIEAADSKHRRRDEQPLRKDVAEMMREYLRDSAPAQPVWHIPAKAFLMLKADLDAAGVAYHTHAGYADFHSLRHTYGTNLGRVARNIKVVQTLMRHSSPVLTARYMHATLHDQVGALEALPTSSHPQRQTLRATGTDGPQMRLYADENAANSLRAPVRTENFSAIVDAPEKVAPTPQNKPAGESHLEGLEPSTFGSVDRRSCGQKTDPQTAPSASKTKSKCKSGRRGARKSLESDPILPYDIAEGGKR